MKTIWDRFVVGFWLAADRLYDLWIWGRRG